MRHSELILATFMSPETVRYQNILKREFESRSARNAGYSLRAYARDLGISPPSLSLILSGRQGLSVATAQRVAKKLGLNASESEYFCDLVSSAHSRSKRARQLASIRLKKQDHSGGVLSLDAFQAMSDWYHFAILELTLVEGFKSSPEWIARSLGITPKVAKLAIERLQRLELLEEVEGSLRQTEGFMATPAGFPSDALKRFHQQILSKAENALFTQTVDERDFSAIVLPINTDDLEWAKEEIRGFRRALMERLESNKRKNKVYCLSVQLFGLQKESVS